MGLAEGGVAGAGGVLKGAAFQAVRKASLLQVAGGVLRSCDGVLWEHGAVLWLNIGFAFRFQLIEKGN